MAERPEVKFNHKKFDEFVKRTRKSVEDVKDANKEFRGAIASIVFRDLISHFTNESGPTGKWKGWSPAYKIRQASRGRSMILQDSGFLRQNLTPINQNSDSRITSRKGELIFFNPAKTKKGFPYAYAHDTGGPKLHQRQFMWLSKPAGRLIANIALKYIVSKDKK